MKKLTSALLASALLVSSFAGLGVAVQADTSSVSEPQIVYADFEEWTSSRNLRACCGLGLSATMTNTMINLVTDDAAVGSQSMSADLPGTNDATWGFFRYGADYINDKYVFTDIQNKLVSDPSYAETCDACITFYAKLADGATDAEGNEIDTLTFNAGIISNANGSQVAYQAEVTITEEWVKYSIPLSSLSDSTVGDLFTQMAANGTCTAGSASAFNHFRFSFSGESGTVYFDQLALAGSDLVAGATISFQYAGASADATTFKTEITTTEDTGSTSSSTSSETTSSEDTSSEDTTSKEEGGDPVGATDADGIYPLDAFTNYSVTSTAKTSSLTMPRADGLLLKTTAAKDSVITIKLSSGSDNLTLTIPVSAGTDMVSMDFANMSSGNAAFSRLRKNNLQITISSDNDVTINSMSYYIYSYLLDRSTLDVDGGDVLMGDTDLSGDVSTVDALLALQHAVGTVTLTGDALTAGDMDYSGDITTTDALLILQLAVGLS